MNRSLGNANQSQAAVEAPSFAYHSPEHDGFFINDVHDSSRYIYLSEEDAILLARWIIAGIVD